MSKAVIFDMDGVICHTNPFHAQAFTRFFEKRNLSPTEEEYFQHMYGKNNGYILSHFLGRKIEHAPTTNVPYEFFTQYSHSIHIVFPSTSIHPVFT